MIHITNKRPTGWYGSFYDTTTQTATSANVPIAMKFNSTDESNGVYISSGSQINVTYAGTYNIQFSAQFQKSNASGADYFVWLAANANTPYAWSNTTMTLGGTSKGVAAWNFVQTLGAGEHFHLFWQTTDTNVSILSASNPGNGMPEIPSIILTVTQV